MNTKEITKEGSKVRVQEAEPQLREPLLYKVIMHNDDFTSMEFVVGVLEFFFSMERAKAINVMFEIHTAGKAVCGIFTKDVAETKVEIVTEYAGRHEHPLMCSIEAV